MEEWNPNTKQYTGRKIEKKVARVDKFSRDDLIAFYSEGEIKEKGLLIISLE